MKTNNVGLREVAAAAAVSIASASHALRQGKRAPFISEKTQRRVRKIARQLRYKVNPSARSLRSGRRHSIAIVCGLLRDRSAISAAESIIAYLGGTTYAGVVTTCGQVKNIQDYVLAHLDFRSHDAVIFIRDDQLIRPDLLRSLQRKKVRVAAIMPDRRGLGKMPLAYLDRPRAAAMMIEVLVEAGHRRIDYIYPESAPAEIHDAIRQAASAAGISPRLIESPLVHNDTNAFKIGIEIVRRKLIASKSTAVAVFTENMALGVAHGFRLLGIDVPGTKSILGYGDSTLLESNEPSISAISHPIEEIGRSIAEQTIGWIEADYDENLIEVKQFSPRYFPRESVRRPT